MEWTQGYDRYIPLEETCRAFDWLVSQGLAHYLGTSQWIASQIMEAYKIWDKFDCPSSRTM